MIFIGKSVNTKFQCVHALDPRSFNGNDGTDSHQIIVIGASKKGYANTPEDFIYFVDTRDNNAGSGYPVYVISYKNFCERAHDTYGLCGAPNSKSYMFYHPKLAPSETKLENKESGHSSKNPSGFWNCKRVTQITVTAACVATGAIIAKSMM